MSDTDTIIDEIRKNPLLDGVTFTGGEPFMQPEPLIKLAGDIKNLERGLNIMVYTGYTIEEIMAENDSAKTELLRKTDILVDGPFINELRSLELNFKGSANQRIIDIAKTLETGNIVCAEL